MLDETEEEARIGKQNAQRISNCVGKWQNRSRNHFPITACLNDRIKSILKEWDKRVAEDPTMIDNLRGVEGPQDLDFVRELVENFVPD